MNDIPIKLDQRKKLRSKKFELEKKIQVHNTKEKMEEVLNNTIEQ